MLHVHGRFQFAANVCDHSSQRFGLGQLQRQMAFFGASALPSQYVLVRKVGGCARQPGSPERRDPELSATEERSYLETRTLVVAK